jgi:hypothetical protein
MNPKHNQPKGLPGVAVQRIVRRLVEQLQDITCGTATRFFLTMIFLVIILILTLKLL